MSQIITVQFLVASPNSLKYFNFTKRLKFFPELLASLLSSHTF